MLPSILKKLVIKVLSTFRLPIRNRYDKALARIRAIVAKPEVGEVYDGIVKSIMPFGAFIEILPGKDGLLHVSEIDYKQDRESRGCIERRRSYSGEITGSGS